MIYDFEELNFKILAIEKVRHTEGTFSVNGRSFAALAFRYSGSGDFEVEGKSFTSRDGDILFLPQNVSYRVKYSPCEIIVIHFADCNYQNTENISVGNPAYIKEEFEKLLHIWNTERSINRAKSGIYKIFAHIENSKTPMPDDTTFARCMKFIDQNFTDPDFDIAKLCTAVNISRSWLLRKFREYLNTSPKKYLTDMRLEYAVDLLISGKYSVKTVSEMCGFKDEKYFSRIISQKYNKPPSAFTKKYIIRA